MYLHVPLDVKKFVGCLTTFDRENLFCLNAFLSSVSLSKLKSPKRNNGNSVFKELYIYEICFCIWWSIKKTPTKTIVLPFVISTHIVICLHYLPLPFTKSSCDGVY